jgi:hypothetical protein
LGPQESKTLLKFEKMAKNFKMASETYIFLFLLSKLQFSTDFKKLERIRSVFLLSNFYRKKLFSKIQNGYFYGFYGCMSANGLILVFTLLNDKKNIIKFFRAPEHGGTKNPPFWIFGKSFFYIS